MTSLNLNPIAQNASVASAVAAVTTLSLPFIVKVGFVAKAAFFALSITSALISKAAHLNSFNPNTEKATAYFNKLIDSAKEDMLFAVSKIAEYSIAAFQNVSDVITRS